MYRFYAIRKKMETRNKMSINYDKWKTIEVSDDEDDTHPNIDTPSLFRWRHRARLERMDAHEQRKAMHSDLHKKLMDEKKTLKNDDEREAWYKRFQTWKDEEEAIKRDEDKMPWNVDTLSQIILIRQQR
ncbi:hypothetical protein ACOME3_004549 [Neoechinorhynchus agilis]